MNEEDAQDLAEADRGESQIDARKAQRRDADCERHGSGRQHGGGEDEREGKAEMQAEQRRGIGPDPHEGRLAERQLADRQNDIHAEREQPVDAERDEQALIGPEEIVEVKARHVGRSSGFIAAIDFGEAAKELGAMVRPPVPGIVAPRISSKFAHRRPARSAAPSRPRGRPSGIDGRPGPPRARCGGRRGRLKESRPKHDRWASKRIGGPLRGGGETVRSPRGRIPAPFAGRAIKPAHVHLRSPGRKSFAPARQLGSAGWAFGAQSGYIWKTPFLIEQTGKTMNDAAKLIELDQRIAVVRENIRELTEQAAAYSGASDRVARRRPDRRAGSPTGRTSQRAGRAGAIGFNAQKHRGQGLRVVRDDKKKAR